MNARTQALARLGLDANGFRQVKLQEAVALSENYEDMKLREQSDLAAWFERYEQEALDRMSGVDLSPSF